MTNYFVSLIVLILILYINIFDYTCVLTMWATTTGVSLQVREDAPSSDVIILDGAAVINMLKPVGAKTFQEYSTHVFLPYIRSQLRNATRVDIVWDVYLEDSLKSDTREKRGKGVRRRVAPASTIPGNWQEFLRLADNKTELFRFLAHQVRRQKITQLVKDKRALTCIFF